MDACVVADCPALSTHLQLQLLPLVVWDQLITRRGQIDAFGDQGARGHQRGCLLLLRAQALAAAGQGGAAAGPPAEGEGGDGGAVITVVGKGLGCWAPILTQLLKRLQRGRWVPGQEQLRGAVQGRGMPGPSLGRGGREEAEGPESRSAPASLSTPWPLPHLDLLDQLLGPQQFRLQLLDLLLHGQHDLPQLLRVLMGLGKGKGRWVVTGSPPDCRSLRPVQSFPSKHMSSSNPPRHVLSPPF